MEDRTCVPWRLRHACAQRHTTTRRLSAAHVGVGAAVAAMAAMAAWRRVARVPLRHGRPAVVSRAYTAAATAEAEVRPAPPPAYVTTPIFYVNAGTRTAAPERLCSTAPARRPI